MGMSMNVNPIIKRIAFKLLVGVALTVVLLVSHALLNSIPELQVWQSNLEIVNLILILIYAVWALGLIRVSERAESEEQLR